MSASQTHVKSPTSSNPQTFVACLDCLVLEPTIQSVARHQGRNHVSSREPGSEEFLAAHARHQTAHLERSPLALSAEQDWPSRHVSASFAATDGSRLYVVTGNRRSRDQPMLYQLRLGTLQTTDTNLAVDEDTLRRGLGAALFPYQLRLSKFRRFMATLQAMIRDLSLNQLELIFESAGDPSTGIVRMPDSAYRDLAHRCASLFDPWELPRIEEFLARDRAQESLLALRVRRQLAALDG